MMYLAIFPLAVCAALAGAYVAHGFRLRMTRRRTAVASAEAVSRAMAWVLVAIVTVVVVRGLAAAPRDAPVVSEPLYEAGVWARTHVPPACVEYLVADPDTAYWLHLAVLGNPRVTARTVAVEAYDLRSAVVRWIEPGGLPYAIADLSAIPADVRREAEVLERFGSAAVLKRRGPGSCD